MADVWNPFDTNNPIYVEVAKKTRRTRRQARSLVWIIVLSGAAYYAGKKDFSPWFGINGRPNQFGVIRRK